MMQLFNDIYRRPNIGISRLSTGFARTIERKLADEIRSQLISRLRHASGCSGIIADMLEVFVLTGEEGDDG